jgi:hypothetical protein
MAIFYTAEQKALKDVIECPIERAKQAAIQRFIDCNGDGVPYTVTSKRRMGHVVFVVRGE